MENKDHKLVKSGDENPVNRASEISDMEAMNGTETWTNAFGDRFGERVCIGVDGNECYHDGEHFVPTAKEIKDLWADHIEQELGCPAQREKDFMDEFGVPGEGKEMCMTCLRFQEVEVKDGVSICKKCGHDVKEEDN